MADMDAVKIEEQKDKATRTLMTMLDFLGLEATLRVEEKGSRLGIKISSPEAGRIIGRKGQSLESLQTLLDRILFRGEESGPRVMLDIDGYAQGNSRSGEGNEGEGNGEGRRSVKKPLPTRICAPVHLMQNQSFAGSKIRHL